MLLDNYNFSVSPIDNLTPYVLAEGSFFRTESLKKEAAVIYAGKDSNGFVKDLEVIDFIKNEYGDRKPVCLLAKLLREIKRVVSQVAKFIGDVLSDVDAWLDENIPGWDEISGFIKDNIIDPIIDVLNEAWNLVEDLFNEVVDFITDIGGC